LLLITLQPFDRSTHCVSPYKIQYLIFIRMFFRRRKRIFFFLLFVYLCVKKLFLFDFLGKSFSFVAYGWKSKTKKSTLNINEMISMERKNKNLLEICFSFPRTRDFLVFLPRWAFLSVMFQAISRTESLTSPLTTKSNLNLYNFCFKTKKNLPNFRE
jgi:hypothetical protein